MYNCRFKYRHAQPMVEKDCDKQCRRENLCGIVTTEFEDDEKCASLVEDNDIF